ncbi:MAG: glycoside hydrolase family 30 beta sandwich domain-containing protein [Bacteroidaceae bacterium]
MKIKRISNMLLTFVSLMTVLLVSCSNTVDKSVPEPITTSDADVSVLVTTNLRSYDLTPDSCSFATGDNLSPHTITVDDQQIYQTMDGFGAAITGSTSYNLMMMTPANRKAFLEETFSPTSGYGFSYVRVAIGCSDFSFSEYTCCDTKGIDNFALTAEENEYVIPILKEIIAINPDLKIMATPWTCPKWMKVTNLTDLVPYDSWTGGELNPAYYDDYATYFVDWIEAFQSKGIAIYSITPQNEPLNRGNSASLYMAWEQEADFINVLGPKLEAANLGVKVIAYDHNYNYDDIASQQDYPVNIYKTEAAKYVDGAAFHNYGGDRSELLRVHEAYPSKSLVFSESSIGEWNAGRNLEARLIPDMEELGLGTVANWCTGVIVWNLMLDNDRGPNREGGCQTCYGAVDISNDNYKSIIRNSHYYVIAHLAAVVKPGAVRIGTSGYAPKEIALQAFKNTDGSYAIVACNTSDESQEITFSDGTHYFMYKMMMKSVVSLRWNK